MSEERDPKVAAAYRALGAEEPPRSLDEAILAASRHPPAGERRPARSWTRRHAVPLSLAAVLVLSVTVTLRMQHERPDIESIARQEPAASAPAVAPEAALKLKVENQIKPAAEAPARQRAKTEMKDAPQAFSRSMREQAPAAPAAAPAPPAPAPAIASSGVAVMQERRDLGRAESSVSGALARQAEERTARDADAAARAPQVGPVQALAKKSVQETPEQELERIAALRRDGKHEEADKALAEFRKRHPDYKLSDALRERVERR
jgi:hypothetical protein